MNDTMPATSVSVPADVLTIQLVGDVSLNGPFCCPRHHAAVTANMAEIASGLGECDLRIVNFESPLWGDGGVNVLKSPRTCTTLDAARCVLPLGIDVALLGNNHMYDCLEKGFDNTVGFLDDNGIVWVGAGRDRQESAKPAILGRRGIRIGLLCYVHADTNPNLPECAGVILNELDQDRVLREVAQLAEGVDVAIVNLHWGADELVSYPTARQRRFAREVVQAGASVVACTHGHCVQGFEKWDNGCIFYGLGNFLFHEFGGRIGREWPKAARRTSVATCVVDHQGVREASLRHLCLEGLALRWDDTAARRRRQKRLNRALRLPDRKLARKYHRDMLYEKLVAWPLRSIRDSGGLLPALCKIRTRHISGILKSLHLVSARE